MSLVVNKSPDWYGILNSAAIATVIVVWTITEIPKEYDAKSRTPGIEDKALHHSARSLRVPQRACVSPSRSGNMCAAVQRPKLRDDTDFSC